VPPPHVAELLSRLADEMAVDLVFMGTPAEAWRVKQTVARVEAVASCADLRADPTHEDREAELRAELRRWLERTAYPGVHN
jgi:hypothetical protein